MAKDKTGGTTAPARRSARDQVKLVEESAAALQELIARIPRGWDYAAEPALTFDPLQGRKPGKAAR